jgi:hypothetical protein
MAPVGGAAARRRVPAARAPSGRDKQTKLRGGGQRKETWAARGAARRCAALRAGRRRCVAADPGLRRMPASSSAISIDFASRRGCSDTLQAPGAHGMPAAARACLAAARACLAAARACLAAARACLAAARACLAAARACLAAARACLAPQTSDSLHLATRALRVTAGSALTAPL